MNPIGGYFELELRKGEHLHKDAIRLNTGRYALEYIVLARKYRKIFVPYYTCEVVLEPLIRHHIAFEFYHINQQLEPLKLGMIGPNDAFLYTNYYGLKQDCVKTLAAHHGRRLIVDNAQAFYARRLEGIDTFYSARKYFGVPDGAFLYADDIQEMVLDKDYSLEKFNHLIKRIEMGPEEGFAEFHQAEEKLDNKSIKSLSRLSDAILRNIDYELVREQRRHNYMQLDASLSESNEIRLSLAYDDVPMIYPYYSKNGALLRNHLIQHKVFCAKYWPNVTDWVAESDFEYTLANNLVAIPCDQRYGYDEMQRIIDIIRQ